VTSERQRQFCVMDLQEKSSDILFMFMVSCWRKAGPPAPDSYFPAVTVLPSRDPPLRG
jgi:hypothetical protein